jgi:AAA family ATP:ADP antiporter
MLSGKTNTTNRLLRAVVGALLVVTSSVAFAPRLAVSSKAVVSISHASPAAFSQYAARSRFSMSSIAADGDKPAKKSFGNRIKSMLPPKAERQKLIPLALMFFCILFNYTILRDTKDVLMVTAPKSGAEVIPFLKTYVNLPTAIAFTGIYAKLTDSMELKNVFYAFVVPFLMFFTSFAFFIYPNRALLHPHALVDSLAVLLPANFAAPLSIIRNWSFAMFYVMAEMWGSMVASLLFWGFANEVTTVDEAKKYCK